ncbi:serine/threonine-protein kinase [Methylocaldum sp.]|uniref:serine/threonine-protein kinase n=1 Tax=Methylocaldum sp. TaxID=1969727 RepID=UPI002D60C0AE|nr:protein kinase [Methylocaldum sp.]HYE34741.1 protein kinase [Methylocaldum sp.]
MRHNALNPGYRLQWFSIEQVLGQGDFGVTYLAHDSILDRHVAIKEYLPVKLAVRDGAALIRPATEDYSEQYLEGLELFIAEARMLAKVEHPNIVRVLNVFVANNTAYMVMSYEEGETLHAVLERRRTLEQGELLRFLIPILDGLERIHNAGFVHCDITPANIMLRKDGSPVLLDFGFARQSLGEKTQTLPCMLSPGYAAVEQYYGKGDQLGPWTDIYSLGATLYRSIAGIAPPDALERSQSIISASKEIFVPARQVGGPRYSEGLLRAVDHALSLNSPNRPLSIAAWRREFSLAPELPPVEDAPKQPEAKAETVAVDPADAPGPRPTSGAARSRILAIASMVLICIGGLVWLNRDLIWEPKRLTALSGAEQTVREDDPAGNDQSAAAAPHEIAPATPPSPPDKSTIKTDAGDQADSKQHEAEIDALFELLAQAGEDIRAGRLISPKDNNALVKYRLVLALAPDQPQAKQGIQEIIDRFAQPAREAMARGDWNLAQTRIDEVTIVLPEAETLRQELNTRRAEAEKEYSKANAEQKPVEQPAAVLPDNKQATQSPSALKPPEAQGDAEKSAAEEDAARKQAVQRTIGRAWRALNREEWDKAQAYIDQTAATLGDAEEVQTLRRQLISRKAKADQLREAAAEGAQTENAGAVERTIQPTDITTGVKIQSATATPSQVRPGETVDFVTKYNLTLPAGIRDTEVELSWVLKVNGRRIGKEGADFKLAKNGINTASNELTVPPYMKPGTYTVEHRVRAGNSKDVIKSYFSVVGKSQKRSDEVAPSEPMQGEQ